MPLFNFLLGKPKPIDLSSRYFMISALNPLKLKQNRVLFLLVCGYASYSARVYVRMNCKENRKTRVRQKWVVSTASLTLIPIFCVIKRGRRGPLQKREESSLRGRGITLTDILLVLVRAGMFSSQEDRKKPAN